MDELKDIPYVDNSSYGHLNQFDLYVLKERTGPGPLVVFAHGGAWRS